MSSARGTDPSPGAFANLGQAWKPFRKVSANAPSLPVASLARQLASADLLNQNFSQEIHSIVAVANPEEQACALLSFATRLSQAELPQAAAAVNQWLDRELALRDEAWVNAVHSQVHAKTSPNPSFGAQAEGLLRDLVSGATDPAMLGGMALGPWLGTGLRAWTAAEGFGAAILGKAIGFAGECGGIWLATQGLQRLQSKANPLLASELPSLGLNLLTLRLVNGRSPWLGIAGLYVGQSLEETLGMRPGQNAADRGVRSLLFWLNAQVAGRVMGHWLGIRMPTFEPPPRFAMRVKLPPIPELVWESPRPSGSLARPGAEIPVRPSLETVAKPMLSTGIGLDSSGWKRLLEEHSDLLRERFALRYQIRSDIPPLNSIIEHFAATRFAIDPKRMMQRYLTLLAVVDLPKIEANQLPRLDYLENVMESFRDLQAHQPFRRASGSLYDHVLQYGLEQAIGHGSGEDFSELIRVAALERSLQGLENLLVSRNWHLKPVGDGEILEVDSARAIAGLARFVEVYGTDSEQMELLTRAQNRAEQSPIAWLIRDRILKLIARGDGTELTKLREVADWQEYDGAALERLIAEAGGDVFRLGRAIDGTIYTGYVADPYLAVKLAEIYAQRGRYLESETRIAHWSQMQEQAAVLLDAQEGRLPIAAQARATFDEADLLKLVEKQATPLAKIGLEMVKRGALDVKLVDSTTLQQYWGAAKPDEAPPESLFLPKNLSPSGRPTILIERIDPALNHQEKIAQAPELPAMFAHEVEHFLHHEDLNFAIPQQLLSAEMRAAVEEQRMRMRNGSSTHWYEAIRRTPQGFGMHLRNEIDRQYFQSEK